MNEFTSYSANFFRKMTSQRRRWIAQPTRHYLHMYISLESRCFLIECMNIFATELSWKLQKWNMFLSSHIRYLSGVHEVYLLFFEYKSNKILSMWSEFSQRSAKICCLHNKLWILNTRNFSLQELRFRISLRICTIGLDFAKLNSLKLMTNF